MNEPLGTNDTNRLIDRLAVAAGPVRRLASPAMRAVQWLCGAGLTIALITAVLGLRSDLAVQMAKPAFHVEWAGALLTGVAAAFAAFHLGQPGARRAWLLLPLPPLLVWSGGLGYGCLADWLRLGPDGLAVGTSYGCLGFILVVGLPLTLLLSRMLRHAVFVRPVETLAAGTLAATSLTSAGLSLLHHLDAAIMVIVWHLGAVVLIATVLTLANRPLFRAVQGGGD